jgi:hypothetical protein
MQEMEFGVTGIRRTLSDGTVCELLTDGEREGWAALSLDTDGSILDWDGIYEDEARELGLIP